MNPANPITVGEITDSVKLAQSRAQSERADRNSAWLQAHVPEIYANHRGKCVCVAGEELFVADDPVTAVALAKSVHPDDDGFLIRYIPKEKMWRIYVASRPMAAV